MLYNPDLLYGYFGTKGTPERLVVALKIFNWKKNRMCKYMC